MDPSADTDSALEQAISTLVANTPAPQLHDIDSAIDAVLLASRDAGKRANLADSRIVDKVALLALEQDETSQTSPERATSMKALKCLGNLVADHNDNRDLVSSRPAALESLKRLLAFGTVKAEDGDYDRATTALKVIYNLCRDYEPAQLKCLRSGLDRAVLGYIHTSFFTKKDDAIDLAVELLGDLAQRLGDVSSLESYDTEFISHLLRLPCGEEVDQEMFEDVMASVSSYLTLPAFQRQVLATNQVLLVLELLERAVFIISGAQQPVEDRAIEDIVTRCLTDISVLDEFPSTFDSDGPLTQALTARCILTENDSDSASVAICACILLGNYATSPATALQITQKINLTQLHSQLNLKAYHRSRASVSTPSAQHHSATATTHKRQTDYLHAAAGMLRHLALSSEAREAYFRDAEAKQTAMALAQYPQADVQVSGLRLLRQLLSDDAASVAHVVRASYPATLIKIFSDSDADSRVQLEVARTIVAMLRVVASSPSVSGPTAGAPEQREGGAASAAGRAVAEGQRGEAAPEGEDSPDEDTASSLLQTRELLAPLAHAILHFKLQLAQAEGWLGLVLALRVSPDTGMALASELLLRNGAELLGALRSQIVPNAAAGADVDDGDGQGSGALLPIQGARTEVGVQGKARDNAIVLLSEVLKNQDVNDEVRDALDAIANEAGITLKL